MIADNTNVRNNSTKVSAACGNDLTASPEARPSTFIPPVPEAHIFIINDRPMLDALATLGARLRIFGNKPMMPGVNVIGGLKNMKITNG
ncbi:MAG: hypothetical protein FWF24_01000 [Alphaproteobacteria bacterium]|nr:hypothetical protein [Alphaproteobacteria bacterium]